MIYFGSLNPERNLEFIINVVEKLIPENKKIKCFFIGGSKNELSKLGEIIKDKKIIDNFILLEQMGREDLFEYVQLCDVSISPIPPIKEYILSSPTKVIESLALGCPVIVNEEIVDQKEIIKKSKGGIYLPYNEEDFINAISDLLKKKEQLKIMSQSGSDYVLKKRSYKELAKKVIRYVNG